MHRTITFGNPLNKIKKNAWLENLGRQQLVHGSNNNSPSFRGVLRGRGRGAIDYQLNNAGELAEEQSRRNLDTIKNKQRFENYTDIRFDPSANQYVGFPKVNGFMEVPLGNYMGTRMFDDQNALTEAGAYVANRRLNVPNRPRNLQHNLRDLEDLEDII
jgi:hypothetical protein